MGGVPVVARWIGRRDEATEVEGLYELEGDVEGASRLGIAAARRGRPLQPVGVRADQRRLAVPSCQLQLHLLGMADHDDRAFGRAMASDCASESESPTQSSTTSQPPVSWSR